MSKDGSITDVAGIRVGHAQHLDERWATGVSAVLAPAGAAAAVDVRGGGPGTRETDVLAVDHLVQHAHAVLLTGGSVYGLAAADGALRWLGERGHGVRVGPEPEHVVPIVPTAALFDLPMNDYAHHPDADFGHRACVNAGAYETREGNVGAGTGAVAGELKGGTGTASTVVGGNSAAAGSTVAALWAVNSSGSVIDPEMGLPWFAMSGLRTPDPSEVASARAFAGTRPGRHGPIARPLNTAIGVVATDLRLSKAEARRLAVAAHDGLARAVRPAHALVDGDTAFALATGNQTERPDTGEVGWPAMIDALCAAAADVSARAVVRGVLTAGTVDEVTSYTARYPSVLG